MTIHDETDQHRFELERLELMNRLAAGMDETTARMLMAHIPSISSTEIATKADLRALEFKLRSEMKVGFTEVNAKIDTGLAHMRGEMGELRGEMGELRGEMGELRGEMGELRGEMGELRGAMGELRGEMGELRGAMTELQGAMAELRGAMAELRGEMHKNSARSIRTTIVAAMFVSLPVVASLIATIAQLYS